MSDERRANVQSDWQRRSAGKRGDPGLVPGTVAWSEHVEAWQVYANRYGQDQSAERIHQRAGFSYAELCEFLGRPPSTWLPADQESPHR